MIVEIALVVFAVTAVVLLPGWLLLDLLKWELSRSVGVSLIPVAFALSVAILSVIGFAGWAAGASLDAVLYVVIGIDSLALLRIASLAAKAKAGPIRSVSNWATSFSLEEKAALGFGAIAVGVAAWGGAWFSHTADTFYHLAATRSLISEDQVLVSRVIYADSPAGLDPTSGTWHLALALIAKVSGLDIAVVWSYLPPLMALLLVLAFYTLAAVLLRNRWWALAAVILHFTLFFEMDFRVAPYPNVIVMGMLWVALVAAFRFLWTDDSRALAVAGIMPFTLAAVHLLAFELYLLSLGVLAGAVLLLLYWHRHLWGDLKRLAVLISLALLVAVPVVVAKAQGAKLVSADETGDGGFRQTFRVAKELEDISLLNWLGDNLLSPITSLEASEWAADNFYAFRPSVLADDILSGETVTFLIVLTLIPGLLSGRRLSIYLVGTAVIVPLILFNPLIVTPLDGRVSDITFIRLPQLVPHSLIWVAVLAPLITHLGRLARRHRLGLARRYALACARRWATLERWRHAVPAPALVAVYWMIVGTILTTVITFSTVDLVNGTVETYLESQDSTFSVQSSKKSALRHDEGIFGYLSQNAPADAVVLADAVQSYYISGLVGTPVVAVPLSHSPRRVEKVDGPKRRMDVSDALNSRSLSTSLSIIRNYNVSFIVTDDSDRTVFDGDLGTFRLVYEDGESRIYEFMAADH